MPNIKCILLEQKDIPLDLGVGRSMEGQTVSLTPMETVVAGASSEIFNDYRERTYKDDDTIATGNVASGSYSHAEGNRTTASGSASHSEGVLTMASGTCCHAEGYLTSSSGAYSHAEGLYGEAIGDASHVEGGCSSSSGEHNIASGYSSHAEGYITTASGYSSHAEGFRTVASGAYSHVEGSESIGNANCAHAEGWRTKANSDQTHAEGSMTTASGHSSHAEGYSTTASGYYSHAGGYGTVASSLAQMVIGRHNVEYKGSEALTANEDGLFIIGKGPSAAARANAFRVAATGVYGSGSYRTSGADYAELFEWADGNPDGEDRIGKFVSLDGDKIRLAGPEDDFILGAISGSPSIVGNVHDDQWRGMYLYDVFGRPLWKDVEVPAETDEQGNIIFPAHIERRQELNPNYDNTQIYISRSKRPEWGCVGMMGKLVVIDDGTCYVNGWCTAGINGIASVSVKRTDFRVISRIDKNHIQILVLNRR